MVENKSHFVISLDFELMWGVRDKRTIESYGANIRGVRKVIPSLLDLFERYKVRATFATVGFLFSQGIEELFHCQPFELPNYKQKNYSPYQKQYMNSIGPSEQEDIYHYAWSIIEQIKQHPQQEIASHTFSHYYCLEGASLSSFEADLIAAKNIAAGNKVSLKSIVFPRNQYSLEHLAICKKLGFVAFRGNEDSSLYQPRSNEEQNKLIRSRKFADAYVNLTGHHGFTPTQVEGLVNIPASKFLRPYSNNLTLLERLRLKRIRDSMTCVAKENKSFHLWWHPHNFGVHLKENLSFLEEILKHYRELQQRYGMESQTMSSIAAAISKTHVV